MKKGVESFCINITDYYSQQPRHFTATFVIPAGNPTFPVGVIPSEHHLAG